MGWEPLGFGIGSSSRSRPREKEKEEEEEERKGFSSGRRLGTSGKVEEKRENEHVRGNF